MSAATIPEWLDAELALLDWNDLKQLDERGAVLLERLADPGALGALVARVMQTPALLAMCERFELFEKVVLHRCVQPDVRLRLHVFGDRFVEAAHNHRSAFVARLINGSYQHLLYGEADRLDDARAHAFKPILAARLRSGEGYSLGASAVHSTMAEPGTVSLVIRGPAVAGTFRILDLKNGQPRTRAGAASAAGPQEEGEAPLGLERLCEIGRMLVDAGLIRLREAM